MKALIQKAFSSANRLWKMTGLLYLFNLGLAVLLAAGFSSALRTGFGNSMLPEDVLKVFDATVYGDFMRAYDHLLSPLMGQVWWFLIVYMFLMTILGAGVVSMLSKEAAPFSLESFFRDCGRFLWRMLRLFALGAGVFAIGGILALFASALIFGFVTSGQGTEATAVTGFVLSSIFFLLFLFLAVLVLDYARVVLIVEDERSVLRSFWRSVKFVFGNFPATTGWQGFMIIVVAVLIAAYLLIAHAFNMATTAGILIVFVVQQASVVSRIWARVVTIGGQVQVFQSRFLAATLPQVLVSPPEKPEPLPAVESVRRSRGKKSSGKRKIKTPAGKRRAAGR